MTIDEWIINGRVGESSKTMWAVLKGLNVKVNYGDKPYDPDHFSRCYAFVDLCNINKKGLSLISEKLPYWKPYIDNWDKLCKMYEENTNTNWKNSKQIGMFEFMQSLRKQSDKIRYNKR